MVSNIIQEGNSIGASTIAGLFGIGNSFLNNAFAQSNSKRQYHFQRNLMNLQNELNRQNQIWTYQNGPSMTRAGLEAAGYNPIMALSNLSNASPQAGLGASSMAGPPSDALGGATNAYQAFKLAREKNNAEVNATNASASLASEQAKTEEFKRRQLESQTFLNNIDHQLRSKDLSWYDRKSLMQVKTGYINAEANALQARSAESQAHSAKMAATASSDYQRSLRDLNTLEYKIRSPRAWHAVDNPLLHYGYGGVWNAVRSFTGR